MSDMEQFKSYLIRNGGTAYPIIVEPANGQTDREVFPGMTLRDWFAGQVLSGNVDGSVSSDTEAEFAYKVADAMIRERSK